MAQDFRIRGNKRSMTKANPLSERPLLTIAIPTYNRAKYLDQLLGVLLNQLHGESRVEVIVSDNASADNTPAVVEGYRQQGLDIHYLRNEANLGADFNILQCYEQASGKYAWIFSDDDLIAPGTLKRVIDALSLQVYDLVCIRAYLIKGDYVRHKKFTPAPDLDLTRAEDLARHVHVLFTFISAVIVNKERISSVPHQPFDSLLDTNLSQLGPFYTALNHHRRSLLIRDPLIAATGNSHVSYALYRVFGPTLTRITREWIENESVQQIIINGAIQRFFPSWILKSRESPASSAPEDRHQVLRVSFGYSPRYWIFDYPIYALPLPLARLWLLGLRVINKIDAVRGGPLLKS
jgi:glycosyltransferase involved in cell wall biosynthesis